MRCAKIVYVSRREAVAGSKRLGNQSPYVCPGCGLWHTTTQAGSLRTKAMRRRRTMVRAHD